MDATVAAGKIADRPNRGLLHRARRSCLRLTGIPKPFSMTSSTTSATVPTMSARTRPRRLAATSAVVAHRPRVARKVAKAPGQGSKAGKPAGRNGQGRGNGGGRRDDARQDPMRSRQEPAVQDPRTVKQPLIIRKGERLPTAEQLDQLSSERSRGEKPALLTRNR